MAILKRVLLAIVLAAVLSPSYEARQTQAGPLAKDLILQAISAARTQKAPAGFVLTKEELCRHAEILSDASIHQSTAAVLAKVVLILGGTFSEQKGVLVYRTPNARKRLTVTLQHTFPRFPALSRTKSYFGAELNGWMKSTLPGNKGFEFDVASSPGEEEGTLDASVNLSAEQIANKLARFKNRAVWIAIDSKRVDSDPKAEMSLRTYPYEVTQSVALPTYDTRY